MLFEQSLDNLYRIGNDQWPKEDTKNMLKEELKTMTMKNQLDCCYMHLIIYHSFHVAHIDYFLRNIFHPL